MYKIGWEATYGYGDILGAYCYSSRISHEKKERVNLEFWWYNDRPFYPPQNKFHPEDPESVLERVELIQKLVNIKKVEITHKDLPEHTGDIRQRKRFLNRNDFNWESTLWEMRDQPEDLGHFAVWSSRTNKEDYRKHTLKHWKVPYTYEEFDDFVLNMQKASGKTPIYVDYRMPVKEVFEIIRTSSFCVGNDGIGNVISKNYFKPIIVTSKDTHLSKIHAGPWAFIINKKEREYDIQKQNLANYFVNVEIENQKEAINVYRKSFTELL